MDNSNNNINPAFRQIQTFHPIKALCEQISQQNETIDSAVIDFNKKPISEQISIYQSIEGLFFQIEENLKAMEAHINVKINTGNADQKMLKNLSDTLNKILSVAEPTTLELSDLAGMIDEMNKIRNQVESKNSSGFKISNIHTMLN